MGESFFPVWGVTPPKTKCKHKEYSCRKCGTDDRKDGLHKTVGGRGVVGQLVDRDKRRKK